MAKITKNIVDKDLRDRIFEMLIEDTDLQGFQRINDRQYGTIMVDLNGNERYCRIPVIVAELREDMTAQELMQSEIDAYNLSQKKKAEQARARKEKAEQDKAKREAKAKEKAEKGE